MEFDNALFYTGILVASWLLSFFIFLSFSRNTNSIKLKLNVKRALFVIAHPDDECMFFGPTIRYMKKTLEDVFILCLSSGNNNGEGRTRKSELRNSIVTLGIPAGNLYVVEHTYLPDDPSRRWREDIVSEIIKKYSIALSVNIVVTFDEYGVSGHRNHSSLYCAVKYLSEHEIAFHDCAFYALESVSLLRKYLSVFDVFSFNTSSLAFFSSFRDYVIIQKAMRCHRSQLLWFRYLYVMFSRYLLMNTLNEIL